MRSHFISNSSRNPAPAAIEQAQFVGMAARDRPSGLTRGRRGVPRSLPWLRASSEGSNNARHCAGDTSRRRPFVPISFDGALSMSFTLPDLPYAYDALVPHMSKET